MLTKNTPIYKLFQKLDTPQLRDSLRSIIHDIAINISGKCTFATFLAQSETWSNFLSSKHGIPVRNEFYKAIYALERDFDLPTNKSVNCEFIVNNDNSNKNKSWEQAMEPLVKAICPNLLNHKEFYNIISDLIKLDDSQIQLLINVGRLLA